MLLGVLRVVVLLSVEEAGAVELGREVVLVAGAVVVADALVLGATVVPSVVGTEVVVAADEEVLVKILVLGAVDEPLVLGALVDVVVAAVNVFEPESVSVPAPSLLSALVPVMMLPINVSPAPPTVRPRLLEFDRVPLTRRSRPASELIRPASVPF